MTSKCHVCHKSDERPTYPDPCCSAPDCENQGDVVHYGCASPYVKQEIDEFWEETDEEHEQRIFDAFNLSQDGIDYPTKLYPEK